MSNNLNLTKCDNLELKCIKIRLAAGLRSDPLPDPITTIRREEKGKGGKERKGGG